MLRQGEAEEVVSLFRGHYNIPLVHVEAGEIFLSALNGVSEPEEKRKIIGRLFVETFDEEAEKIAADGRGAPEFLGARHALSRRDRKRLLSRRPVGHDQVAS